MIHEGTHGIQGMDLLGRKVVMDGGAGLKLLATTVQRTIDRTTQLSRQADGLAAHGVALAAALQRLRAATDAAWATGKPEDALANATPYLQAFGHVVLAWIWLEVALAALAAQAAADRQADAFVQGKLQACHYYCAYELPKIDAWLAVVSSRSPICREMQDAWF